MSRFTPAPVKFPNVLNSPFSCWTPPHHIPPNGLARGWPFKSTQVVLLCGWGMKVSYPDGEVTHPPGEYMVELPSAAPPYALLLHICDEITRKESFTHRHSGHIHLEIFTLLVFSFNLGGHSSVGSQQCPLLLEETWYQLPDFAWCF